jgi:hypothetical protein
MQHTPRFFHFLIVSFCLILTSCGGGGSSGGGSSSTMLSGTAAAGAAIIGTVTVKDALGATKSALIEADGSYNINVSGLTAPYRLRAQGTVGGKTYKLHSYAEAADVGGNVNITPFTDLIIANAAGQVAESFYDSSIDTELDPVVLVAQKTALKAKLQNVLTALGVDAAIDLLSTTFRADHSGLDAALDLVKIEKNTGTNIFTITNLLDNSSITDDIDDTEDNTETLVVDEDALDTAVTDTQAIVALFNSFAARFANGLPSLGQIENYFAADFLQNDESKGAFLTDITTDSSIIGLGFAGVVVSELDSTSVPPTAKVTFNVRFGDDIDPRSESWLVAKDSVLGWQLRGDQRIVDIYELSFHCNRQSSGSDEGACGINVSMWDEDFSNNGTGDVALSSGTVSIFATDDLSTAKAVIYLGTRPSGGAGEIEIYNASSSSGVEGYYSGDWRAFGTGANEIDSALFAEGDVIEYKVFEANLDLSDPSAPAVTGTAVATYTGTLLFEPSLTPLYPSPGASLENELLNFALGDSLTVSWTLADGTISDEVLVQISDRTGNRFEIWDDSIDRTQTSLTIASSELDATTAADAGLDADAEIYDLLVRVYAADETTGQYHSTDYVVEIAGPGASNGGGDGGGDGGGSNFACTYESGWDDNADGGAGAPITPNSFADYEAVVADCGTAMTFTFADVASNVFVDANQTETTSFNNDGAGTEANRSTGTYVDGGETILFEWYIEDATCTGCSHSYLVLYSDDAIDSSLGTGVWFRETTALVGLTGELGAVGSAYNYRKYSEQFNFSDNNRATGIDGEIWRSVDTIQAIP